MSTPASKQISTSFVRADKEEYPGWLFRVVRAELEEELKLPEGVCRGLLGKGKGMHQGGGHELQC